MLNLVLLETQSLGDDVDISCFKQLCNVTAYTKTRIDEVKERLKDADIVIANKVLLNEETLSGLERLKLIALTATGTNNVDFDYVNRVGIKVANVSGYSTMSVVQHTFAMLLYVYEKLAYYDNFVKDGGYSASGIFSVFDNVYHELDGKKFCVVGLGAIGTKVLETAKCFGCDVSYYSTSGAHNDERFKRVDFDTMLAESDIISIHAPLNENTNNMFTINELRKMKKSAILLNLGRGGIINEADLAKALLEDEIAAAGIDVVSVEPIAIDNPLMQIKDSTKLIITPHIGWGTIEARTRVVSEVYKNIEAYMNGENRNIVTKH